MEVDDENKGNDNVDESLYSRQLYVIDHESMKKMQQSTVLIAGMNGLGVEIAKNTILAGVKSVTIFDPTVVQINDLASNFYATPQAVGKQTRAQSSIEQLKSLNPYVNVECITNNASLQQLIESKSYDVIVLVNYPLKEVVNYNKLAHALNLRFISCDCCGVFGQIFVDFGQEFECTDLTGEPPMQGMVVSVTKEKEGVVTVHEDTRHGMVDGDFVEFKEIEGMTQLNELKPRPIKVLSAFTFSIGDTTAFDDYTGQGLFFQVKQGAKLSFLPLSELLGMSQKDLMNAKQPKIIQTDFAKNAYEQHLFYLALQEYRESNNGKYPLPTNKGEENEKVYAFFTKLCAQNELECKEEATKAKYSELARASSAVISPMCAFLGGIVGQEVLKACSHKFTPLQQLLYFDAFECLPVGVADSEQFAAQNCRYDDNLAVFGKDIQEQVLKAKLFLVGAGAIGCEMLKNWALMGVACDARKQGSIVVTDMDRIERSNLNRQFLFRETDIGSAKSTAAAKAARAMNADIHIVSHENRVGAESEHIYNFDFWSALNAVCTALDNVQARLYVDAQCVYYNKPLLESGTLGTKGNTQIVVPKMTESYGSTRDPEERGVPICTLKNFPNKIEHTIQWARDDFEGEFAQTIIDINKYIERGDAFLKEIANKTEEVSTLQKIRAGLQTYDMDADGQRPLNFQQCVQWARNKFEHDFTHRIKQLLYNFPHDAVTTEGAKFWSPPKRAPNVIEFDAKDALHLAYITAAANLRAFVYGLKGSAEAEEITALLQKCTVKQFEVDPNKKIAANDKEKEEEKASMEMDDDEIEKLRESLKGENRKQFIGMTLSAIEFEKDDDSNFHMDFITCSANLRARNYRIEEKSKHDIKKIAGKIIPAIATTTALVTGLISLEFYKLVQSEKKKIEDYRSCYVNLALPLLTMSEPVAAGTTSVNKKGDEQWQYTLWDVIEPFNKGNGREKTVQDLLSYFEHEWASDLEIITYGNAIVYAFYMADNVLEARRSMKLLDLVQQVCGKVDDNARVLCFEVSATKQDSGEDLMLPTVSVYI